MDFEDRHYQLIGATAIIAVIWFAVLVRGDSLTDARPAKPVPVEPAAPIAIWQAPI